MATKRSIKNWERGVEFFVGASGGLGYREPNGIIWFSPGGRQADLMPPQMLRIIAASGEALPGWEPRLHEDWFRNPRRKVGRGQKRPVDVMRAFRDVLEAINTLYPSLSGSANASTAQALRSLAAELRGGGSDFYRPLQQAKRALSRDEHLNDLVTSCIGIRADGGLREVYARRLDFSASMAESERDKDPLLCLMPSLETWFTRLFDKPPARVWKNECNALGEEVAVPGGAFPALASALLLEVGLQYTPKSIHSKLGRWRTRQKLDSLRD